MLATVRITIKKTDKQTDRQKNRQTDRQTDRHTDRQTYSTRPSGMVTTASSSPNVSAAGTKVELNCYVCNPEMCHDVCMYAIEKCVMMYVCMQSRNVS